MEERASRINEKVGKQKKVTCRKSQGEGERGGKDKVKDKIVIKRKEEEWVVVVNKEGEGTNWEASRKCKIITIEIEIAFRS